VVVVVLAINEEDEVQEELWVCKDFGEPGDKGEVGSDPAGAAALWVAALDGSSSKRGRSADRRAFFSRGCSSCFVDGGDVDDGNENTPGVSAVC